MTSDQPSKPDEFVTIGQFSQAFEAHIVRAKLESEEIECLIQDENTIMANPAYSNMIGGVKLQVKESDVEKARTILDDV